LGLISSSALRWPFGKTLEHALGSTAARGVDEGALGEGNVTRRTEFEATVQRFERVLDQMGRAFTADLALAELERRAFAELERRLDAFEQAEPSSQNLADTCEHAGKLERQRLGAK
jgi:hypothetical protein